MSLVGKSVVITGSTRGIGRSIAEACAREGAHVLVSSRTQSAVDRAVAEMGSLHEGSGARILGMACDVSDASQVAALLSAGREAFGHVDVWVNNAGISEGYRPLDELEPGELAEICEINLIGHMYGAREALRHFRERGQGYLMNMSGRGYKGDPTPHTAAYASTKVAIASLTRSLAAENRDVPGISVNAIVPGMVATDFYVDVTCSPRLESTRENWRYALDAFGVPLDEVGRRAARLLGEQPGKETGRIYSFISTGQAIRGGAKMAWWGMTGRLGR